MRFILALFACLLALGPARAEDFSNGGFSFSTGPAPAFVVERAPQTTWPADAPGTNDGQWRYWRFDRQVDRRPGQDIAYTDYIYEPRSQGNVGEAGRFDVQFNPEYQKLVLHRVELFRNGHWQSRLKPGEITIARREQQFEQEISDGTVTALIVIEDVRVGDVIRISFSVIGSNPILAGQTSEQTRLSIGHPILDLRLRTLYPPGTAIRVHRENGAPEPAITNTAAATQVEIAASRIDRLQDEGDYPVWYQPHPLVQFAPRRTWTDVVAWALPLYPDRGTVTLPDDLELRITRWKQLPTAGAKLKAALRAVQDEVRYFGVETGTSSHRPREPALVWQRHYGDCKDKAWLLVTLLGRLGIQAVPALVDTERGRAVGNYAPAADLFNHVIVRAVVDGGTVFVDPTLRLQGGTPQQGDLSSYGNVLPVIAGQEGTEAILPPKRVATGIETHEHFSAEGDKVRLTVQTEYRGMYADRERQRLDQERIEDRARRYREYYGKRYGTVDSSNPLAVEDDRDNNLITIRESYLLASPWKADGSMRTLGVDAGAVDGVSTLPARTERQGPLDFAIPGRYLDEVTVSAPSGWIARFEQEEKRVDGVAFSYRRVLDPEAGRVRLVSEMTVSAREVGQAEVPAHLAALRQVRDTLHTGFVYRAPASVDAARREERLQNLLRDVMEDH